MKWIDEKGRLWGRINIIDFVLILIVIAALAFVGMKFLGKGEITIIAEKQEIKFTMFANTVHNFVEKEMKEGDVIRLESNNAVLGKISKLEKRNAYGLIATLDGRWVEADIPNKYAITFELTGEAVKSGDTYTIGGMALLVGSEITVKGPNYTLKAFISDVP